MTRRINLHLDDVFAAEIEQRKPKSLALSAFCALLIEKALDVDDRVPNLPACRAGAGTQLGSHPTECIGNSQPQQPPTEAETCAEGDDPQAQQDSESSRLSDLLAQALEPKKKGGCGGKKIDFFTRRALDRELIPPELLDCEQLLTEFWACKKGTRSQSVFTRVCNKLRQWSPDQRQEALERAIASGWGDVFDPPSVRAQGASGYVDSITRDRLTEERFLAMFNGDQEADQ